MNERPRIKARAIQLKQRPVFPAPLAKHENSAKLLLFSNERFKDEQGNVLQNSEFELKSEKSDNATCAMMTPVAYQ